jgi:thiamine kinase-like enzyme
MFGKINFNSGERKKEDFIFKILKYFSILKYERPKFKFDTYVLNNELIYNQDLFSEIKENHNLILNLNTDNHIYKFYKYPWCWYNEIVYKNFVPNNRKNNISPPICSCFFKNKNRRYYLNIFKNISLKNLEEITIGRKELSSNIFFDIGKLIRNVHDYSEKKLMIYSRLSPPYFNIMHNNMFDTSLLSKYTNLLEISREVNPILNKFLCRINDNKYVAVHNDLSLENILINLNNIPILIDYEFLILGHRFIDLFWIWYDYPENYYVEFVNGYNGNEVDKMEILFHTLSPAYKASLISNISHNEDFFSEDNKIQYISEEMQVQMQYYVDLFYNKVMELKKQCD